MTFIAFGRTFCLLFVASAALVMESGLSVRGARVFTMALEAALDISFGLGRVVTRKAFGKLCVPFVTEGYRGFLVPALFDGDLIGGVTCDGQGYRKGHGHGDGDSNDGPLPIHPFTS